MKRFFVCVALALMPLSGYCEPCAVKADLLEATVYYYMVSQTKDKVQIRVQYESTAATAEVYDVKIYPYDAKSDGEYTYSCPSLEGEDVIFRFEIKNGELRKAQIDTKYRPKALSGQEQQALTLKSLKGHPVIFTFSFKEGRIAGVNIKPGANPFSS